MSDSRTDIEHLTIPDCDVEELERRLEMSLVHHPMSYYCDTDCPTFKHREDL